MLYGGSSHLVNGAKKVRILGQQHRVRARVAQIHGFSAHADRDGLLRWLSGFKKPLRHLFVTHGEYKAASFFSKFVRQKTSWETSAPEYLAEVILE
ncbi:MBL fold metallo-hydrolase RNA specificity domain-containing protein [Chloroflexota bacterium]